MPCDLFQRTPLSLVLSCTTETLLLTNRKSTPARTSTTRECSSLMEQSGSCPSTGQEKRIIVQHFALFQQFSRPGAKGSTFARILEAPRCEAACVLRQRKDFVEHRLAGCSPRAGVRSPPVDPSWTCRCTARLAHHKASPRRLQLGHCFCSRLAKVAERPFWESALATNAVGHQAEKRQSTRHADKRRPG